MSTTALIHHPIYLSLATAEPNGAGTIVRFIARRKGVGGALEGFDQLARGERLTVAQSRLTGITNAQLDRAPDTDSTFQDFVEFAKGADAWIIANGKNARENLRETARSAGYPTLPVPAIIGIDDLAAIVMPTAGRTGVRDLAILYGRPAPTTDESDSEPDDLADEPELLELVWRGLETDLTRLPLALLAEMNWMLAKSDHPLRKLLKSAEGLAVDDQFSETFHSGKVALEKLFKDFSKIIDTLRPPEEEEGDSFRDEPPRELVKPEEVRHMMGEHGPLSKLNGYEERPEQETMSARVADAFNRGTHLMIEAGTGVGKSLAYLVPSIMYAKKSGRPVMVSTHTKNLQSQLFGKDIPFLKKHLGLEFEAALLRGRPNYLCLRKFMYAVSEAPHELDETERAQMLPILSWAVKTEHGDVSELAAFSPEQNPALWDRLHTVGDDCLKRACPFYKRCFVYKARGLAKAADVVVLNHALVFSALNSESGMLPRYGEIVFDEAHKLEEVATDHLACEIAPRRIYRILNRLYRASGSTGAGKGLLPTLLSSIEQARSEFGDTLHEQIRTHLLETMQAVSPANDGSESFFEVVRDWTETPEADPEESSPQPFVPFERGRGGRAMPSDNAPPAFAPFPKKKAFQSSDDRKRYSTSRLKPDEAVRFKTGKESAISGLGKLRQTLERLEEDFPEIRKRQVQRSRELLTELSAQNTFLQELIHDIEFIVKGDEPNYVYWSERWGRTGARMVAAPLDIAALLHGQLYEKKRSIILTSATLSVRDADAGDVAGLAPFPNRMRPNADQLALPAKKDAPRFEDESMKPHPKSFEFLKLRFGLSYCQPDKLNEMLLGSPFDYEDQCRLYVPTFLPEPGGGREKEYTAQFSAMVAELAIASEGRALVLFTSYSSLDACAAILRKLLVPEGIEVLAQGRDGSRESLLSSLKSGGRRVLLGTSSFWEGVDVRGEALSLLVIHKLPFAVFTDPVIQGRCEILEAAGKDAFLHFSVPNAILKLRQGFGRLIRSKQDRGIVVLADKRVITKRYGAAFLRALPAKAQCSSHLEGLVSDLKSFIGESDR
ncbi:MAG: helicase C-terminal domain-containing protein [Planctomycetota bacterium]